MHEVTEVLRLWLPGEGFRSVARVDRKTVRQYVAAAEACGLERAGGEGQLAMSCWVRWPSASARIGVTGMVKAGRCWLRITRGCRSCWMRA